MNQSLEESLSEEEHGEGFPSSSPKSLFLDGTRPISFFFLPACRTDNLRYSRFPLPPNFLSSRLCNLFAIFSSARGELRLRMTKFRAFFSPSLISRIAAAPPLIDGAQVDLGSRGDASSSLLDTANVCPLPNVPCSLRGEAFPPSKERVPFFFYEGESWVHSPFLPLRVSAFLR